MSADVAAEPIALLCPGCCTLDAIPKYTPSLEVLAPLVGCRRCGFLFPILPAEFKQVTLDALHNHECRGRYRGNWPELGQAIAEAVQELKISPDQLAERLEGLWPDSETMDAEGALPRGTS
jgi:hypothetical protein